MRASEFTKQELDDGYKEIEFVCVNPQFPDATDPALQKKMYRGLKQIDGVVPLWQEWGDYSEGQASLSAIYQDSDSRDKILSLAKQLGVEVDLEQAVSADYVDRARRGEHEGQQGVAERKQSPLEDFEGLQFRMVHDNGQLFVNAFDSSGGNELGHVTFDIGNGKELDPQNLYVKHKFRSQGIARTMYDFVKSKGYKIQRSWDQTDAGAGFWDKHRGEERVWEQDDSEARSHDFMAGHCHVMALALKQLHPDWQIRAHVGYDDDEADDAEYRVDHVYTVAPDGTAYDCRGKFSNEQQLVGPDTTGGVDTQYVNFGPEEIKQAMLRGELKRFSKQDLANAMQVGKQVVAENFADGRNPQDKGDSKRHGIPKRASLTQLDKIGRGSGRKAQLARWQANMRRGRAK